jgi:hypothetical protein
MVLGNVLERMMSSDRLLNNLSNVAIIVKFFLGTTSRIYSTTGTLWILTISCRMFFQS